MISLIYRTIIVCFIILLAYSCSEDNIVNNEIPYINKTDTANVDSNIVVEYESDFSDTLHPNFDSLDNYFYGLHRNGVLNGNVLVAKGDTIIYKNTFGFANLKTKDSLHIDAPFQLGSMAKQFTAVAILMLVEEGKLDLTDTIQKFIPDFPYHDISIHTLLTHQSGLPEYRYFLDNILGKEYRSKIFFTNQDVIDSLIALHPDGYGRPNQRFNYRNTNYTTLASIIEVITNKAFTDFVDEKIFDPLKMKSTFFYHPEDTTTYPHMTTGYTAYGREATDDFSDGVYGDKGIYSTVSDLLIWNAALDDNFLISDSLLQKAFTPGRPQRKGIKNYGYGWRLKLMDDGTWLPFHGGWWHGYFNMMVHEPKDNIYIIVLTNRKTGMSIDSERIIRWLKN
jgi:CubicO group peptidase (beta-lactamase class C family)